MRCLSRAVESVPQLMCRLAICTKAYALQHYNDDGSAIRDGCPYLGSGCTFVHPSEPSWKYARPSKQRKDAFVRLANLSSLLSILITFPFSHRNRTTSQKDQRLAMEVKDFTDGRKTVQAELHLRIAAGLGTSTGRALSHHP